MSIKWRMRSGGSCSREESDWTILTQTPPPGSHKSRGMNFADLTTWKGCMKYSKKILHTLDKNNIAWIQWGLGFFSHDITVINITSCWLFTD